MAIIVLVELLSALLVLLVIVALLQLHYLSCVSKAHLVLVWPRLVHHARLGGFVQMEVRPTVHL